MELLLALSYRSLYLDMLSLSKNQGARFCKFPILLKNLAEEHLQINGD